MARKRARKGVQDLWDKRKRHWIARHPPPPPPQAHVQAHIQSPAIAAIAAIAAQHLALLAAAQTAVEQQAAAAQNAIEQIAAARIAAAEAAAAALDVLHPPVSPSSSGSSDPESYVVEGDARVNPSKSVRRAVRTHLNAHWRFAKILDQTPKHIENGVAGRGVYLFVLLNRDNIIEEV